MALAHQSPGRFDSRCLQKTTFLARAPITLTLDKTVRWRQVPQYLSTVVDDALFSAVTAGIAMATNAGAAALDDHDGRLFRLVIRGHPVARQRLGLGCGVRP